MFLVLKGNLFPSILTQESWKKFFCLSFWPCLWLCWHHLFLLWRICHQSQGSWNESTLCLFCLFLPCVSAGVLKGVSVHVSLMTHMPSTPRFLKWVNLCLFGSFLPHVSDWGLERSLGVCFSGDSYAIYIKGLERSRLRLLSPALCVDWGLKRSLIACACSHGLGRTGWMVLKGLWCNFLVPP